MTEITKEQQEEVIKAMNALVNAWESDEKYTEDDMCKHMEEIINVFEGNSFKQFMEITGFRLKKQLWMN